MATYKQANYTEPALFNANKPAHLPHLSCILLESKVACYILRYRWIKQMFTLILFLFFLGQFIALCTTWTIIKVVQDILGCREEEKNPNHLFSEPLTCSWIIQSVSRELLLFPFLTAFLTSYVLLQKFVQVESTVERNMFATDLILLHRHFHQT